MVASQLQSIVANSAGKVGIGLAVGIALALWSASSGVSHLIEAINRAYDESETRGFVRRKAVALGFTVVAVVFVVGAVFVITSLPAVVQHLPGTVRSTIGIARWVILLGGMVVGLSVLYRYGPDRDSPKWRWASAGAIVAALLWVAASALFAVYTANFASYNQTYGSLGAVVVLLLWLFITAFAVIVGAELNCELERQTVVDSTVGQPRPMGSRRALAADTVGPTADELHEQSAGIEEHRFAARAADVRAGVAPTVGVGPTVDHRTKRWATIIGLIAVAAAAVTGRIGGETTSREGK